MKDDRLYLHHMLERCHRITRFIAPGREVWNVALSGIPELQTALEQFLAVQDAGSPPAP